MSTGTDLTSPYSKTRRIIFFLVVLVWVVVLFPLLFLIPWGSLPGVDAGGGGRTEVAPVLPNEPQPSALATERSTTSTTSTTTATRESTGSYVNAEDYAGRSVAVIWSQRLSALSSRTWSDVAEQQRRLESALDVDLIWLDSDQFGNLSNGTVALAYDGGFESPNAAVSWCIGQDRSTRDQCFGVRLLKTGLVGEARVYP